MVYNADMTMTFDEQYARLNPDQKLAVDTIDGPVLVIAGPGTGKTQVLGLRIANILKVTDSDPGSILCLTFQDASVQAMKTRLQKFIGNAAYKVNIHTFHSFCSEIIRTFPYEFEFTDDVEAIKDIDKLQIYKDILTHNKLTSLQQRNDILGNFKGISSAISNLKKEFVSPQKLAILIENFEQSLEEKVRKLEARKIEKMRDLHTFYIKYLERMQESNLIDFDDMIYKVTERFSTNEELVTYFQEQYLYTLVDEFQDTNNAQLELIKSVSRFQELESNIFAVGDDDQTIFRFQGASSDNFDAFLNIFPQSEIIVLHTNYRSNQRIIDASADLIQHNPGRISESKLFQDKNLSKHFTASQTSTAPENTQAHEFEHSFHEDFWIGRKITELTQQGVKLSDIAIIARTNRQIVSITKFLDSFNLPYLIRRSESILEDKHIKHLITILEIIHSPEKLKVNALMWEVLSQDFLGQNDFDVFSLYHDAKEREMTMYDFVKKTNLPKYNDILTFLNQILALNQYSLNNSIANTFTKTIHGLQIIKFFESLPDSYTKINKVSSLFQYISTRMKFIKEYSLETFLDEIQIMLDKNIVLSIDPIDIHAENKVNIITAHSAKGLEFEYVIVYQCSETKWEKQRGGSDAVPLPPMVLRVDKEAKKLETEIDERRLFYVAMTRAKRALFLTYSKRYFDSDSGEVDTADKTPSKFLIESGIQAETHPELAEHHDEIMKIVLAPEEPVVVPDKNKAFLQGLISKKVTLSASKLNRYKKCNYRFLLEQILEIPTPQSLNLEIGSAIHKGIEMLNKSYTVQDDKVSHLSLEQLTTIALATFEVNLDRDQLVDTEIGSIDVAIEEITRGLKAYFDYFMTKPETSFVSEFFATGEFQGIKLAGRIDRIGGSEQLVITDFKTTSNLPTITEFLGLTKHADKAHLRQLLFYKLLLENAYTKKARHYASKVAGLSIEYIDTKKGEVKVFDLPRSGIFEYHPRANSRKTAEFDLNAEFEQLKEDLKHSFTAIVNLEFNRTEDRRECQYCPFKTHCGR